MLRPAFQYAGPLLGPGLLGAGVVQSAGDSGGGDGRGGSGDGVRVALLAPYAGGVLLVAVPWVLLNGLVFGSFTWSRTGDAWQQVYWGIYPPNRGWWPPTLPSRPSSGWRASRGRGGRDGDRDARPGLPGSGGVAGAVHPLQALATEAHKLYRGYLHPFNTYAEAPPLS